MKVWLNLLEQDTQHHADAMQPWLRLSRKLRWQWWGYIVVAVIGTAWFIRSLPPREPVEFAVLLLIPLISLRQAWKVDRAITLADPERKPNK